MIFAASDKSSYLNRAEYSVNGGEWQAVFAEDGISDSPDERYTIEFAVKAAGEYVVTLRVFDANGNAGNARAVVRTVIVSVIRFSFVPASFRKFMALDSKSVAVITGAASGIGQALAVRFAREGVAGVAISDVNEAGLNETADRIKEIGVPVSTHLVDVSKLDQVQKACR